MKNRTGPEIDAFSSVKPKFCVYLKKYYRRNGKIALLSAFVSKRGVLYVYMTFLGVAISSSIFIFFILNSL